MLKCFFLHFQPKSHFYGENKKNSKKIVKFQYFFHFEVQYLGNRLSDFDDFFYKMLKILFYFHNKKEQVIKNYEFRKTLENVNLPPENAKLAKVQNSDPIAKNGLRIRIQQPKISGNPSKSEQRAFST